MFFFCLLLGITTVAARIVEIDLHSSNCPHGSTIIVPSSRAYNSSLPTHFRPQLSLSALQADGPKEALVFDVAWRHDTELNSTLNGPATSAWQHRLFLGEGALASLRDNNHTMLSDSSLILSRSLDAAVNQSFSSAMPSSVLFDAVGGGRWELVVTATRIRLLPNSTDEDVVPLALLKCNFVIAELNGRPLLARTTDTSLTYRVPAAYSQWSCAPSFYGEKAAIHLHAVVPLAPSDLSEITAGTFEVTSSDFVFSVAAVTVCSFRVGEAVVSATSLLSNSVSLVSLAQAPPPQILVRTPTDTNHLGVRKYFAHEVEVDLSLGPPTAQVNLNTTILFFVSQGTSPLNPNSYPPLDEWERWVPGRKAPVRVASTSRFLAQIRPPLYKPSPISEMLLELVVEVPRWWYIAPSVLLLLAFVIYLVYCAVIVVMPSVELRGVFYAEYIAWSTMDVLIFGTDLAFLIVCLALVEAPWMQLAFAVIVLGHLVVLFLRVRWAVLRHSDFESNRKEWPMFGQWIPGVNVSMICFASASQIKETVGNRLLWSGATRLFTDFPMFVLVLVFTFRFSPYTNLASVIKVLVAGSNLVFGFRGTLAFICFHVPKLALYLCNRLNGESSSDSDDDGSSSSSSSSLESSLDSPPSEKRRNSQFRRDKNGGPFKAFDDDPSLEGLEAVQPTTDQPKSQTTKSAVIAPPKTCHPRSDSDYYRDRSETRRSDRSRQPTAPQADYFHSVSPSPRESEVHRRPRKKSKSRQVSSTDEVLAELKELRSKVAQLESEARVVPSEPRPPKEEHRATTVPEPKESTVPKEPEPIVLEEPEPTAPDQTQPETPDHPADQMQQEEAQEERQPEGGNHDPSCSRRKSDSSVDEHDPPKRQLSAFGLHALEAHKRKPIDTDPF